MEYKFSSYQSHYKNLLLLGIPVIIGQLGNIIMGIVDTLMIGHYGTMELGAASFVNSIFTLIIISAMGFTYGLTPLVGALCGRGDSMGVGGIVKNSLVANTIVAVLLMLFMTIFYFCLDHIGQPEELLPLMKSYFMILLTSIPLVLWFNTFKQFADGITDTRSSMWILLSGNVLNIIGNYLLIYGKLGFLELGLDGAGIATVASRAYMVLVAFLLFVCGKYYRPFWNGFKRGKVNKRDLLELNRLGWPVFLQMGMETASFSLSSIMVGWIGSIALASHQVMLTISQICYMVYYGMSSAVAVRVSHFKGQGDILNLEKTATAGFHLILVLALLTSVPILLLKNVIGSWFTDNQEVSLWVAQCIIPFIIYQFGDGLQCNYANSLRGIGDVKPMIIYAFFAYFVISLPIGYLLGIVLKLGLVGIWFAFPFGLTTAGILYLRRFRKSVSSLFVVSSNSN
jgi:MATE family multidrug resistance protein